jgi:hypothetical protein
VENDPTTGSTNGHSVIDPDFDHSSHSCGRFPFVFNFCTRLPTHMVLQTPLSMPQVLHTMHRNSIRKEGSHNPKRKGALAGKSLETNMSKCLSSFEISLHLSMRSYKKRFRMSFRSSGAQRHVLSDGIFGFRVCTHVLLVNSWTPSNMPFGANKDSSQETCRG